MKKEKSRRNVSGRRSALIFAVLIALPCVAMLLGGCGKKTDGAESAASSAASVQTTAAASEAAQTDTSAGSEAASASVKPGAYTEQQSAAEQAIEAAQAAAPFHEEDFRKNVGAGMEARWTVLDSRDPDGMDLEEFRKYAADSVQAELDAIGDFYLYSFSDKTFEQAAGMYMAALAAQTQGIMEIQDPEELTMDASYMKGYYLRILALHDLSLDGEIPVSEKYKGDLDALLGLYDDAKSAMKVKE